MTWRRDDAVAFAMPVLPVEAEASADVNSVLQTLPDPFSVGASANRYIRAAAMLQRMGKDKAVERLHDFGDVGHGKKSVDQVFVLCRMLFVARKEEFRRPAIGGPVLFGGSQISDWPLEPIDIVDGVPFVITSGYILAGRAERPQDYLRFCLEECDWNPYEFSAKSPRAKRLALAKLLASKRFQKPVEDRDRQFLLSQIK